MFEGTLKEVLKNFSKAKMLDAEKLCYQLHKAESQGYQITKIEDELWVELTDKMIQYS